MGQKGGSVGTHDEITVQKGDRKGAKRVQKGSKKGEKRGQKGGALEARSRQKGDIKGAKRVLKWGKKETKRGKKWAKRRQKGGKKEAKRRQKWGKKLAQRGVDGAVNDRLCLWVIVKRTFTKIGTSSKPIAIKFCIKLTRNTSRFVVLGVKVMKP